MHLEQFGDRYPSQLSGGQRQRMALARALAVEPEVLLLDEPFGALDAKVRKELRDWLRRLHDEVHVTTVFVTHDQEEAMDVADRICRDRPAARRAGGHARTSSTSSPANDFVMSFLGPVTKLNGASASVRTIWISCTSRGARMRCMPGSRGSPGSASRCGSRSRSTAMRARSTPGSRSPARQAAKLGIKAGDDVVRAQGRQGADLGHCRSGLTGSVAPMNRDESPRARRYRGLVLRMSKLFLRTLRDDPADAEVASHQLLVRAGYVRRVASGIWTWLPLGKIVLDHVARMVREEMERIGGQEVLLPGAAAAASPTMRPAAGTSTAICFSG